MQNILKVGQFITIKHYDKKDEKGNLVVDEATKQVVQSFSNIAIIIDKDKEIEFSGQVLPIRISQDYKGVDLLSVKSNEKYYILFNESTYDGKTSYVLTYCSKTIPEISLND